MKGNKLPSAKSLFLSELRASHEQRLPDFSSGNSTAINYIRFEKKGKNLKIIPNNMKKGNL